MFRKAIFIFLLLKPITSQAQAWGLRGSVNGMHSYNSIEILSWNGDKTGLTTVSTNKNINRIRHVFGRQFKFPLLNFYYSLEVIREINKKHSVILGYQNMNPGISSTIKTTDHYPSGSSYSGTNYHTELNSINFPALKLNYRYILLSSSRTNNASLCLYGGLLLSFKGKDAFFGGTEFYAESGYVDSSGNLMRTSYVYTKRLENIKSFVTFLNLGVEGSLSVSKRIKVGMNIETYFSGKSPYAQQFFAKTMDAEFTYNISLKPIFISGGFYLQYRIK